MTWGTPEQKERYLTPILTAEEIWCQGFSEPDAGSDLASLKTRAVKDERRLGRHRSEGLDQRRAVLAVVHAGRAHRPRRPQAQGADLLPDGHASRTRCRSARCARSPASSEFNELFIDGARIPDENVLGGVGNGWKVALTTLMNERAGLAFFLQVRLRQLLDRLIDEAARAGPARRSGRRRPARRAAPEGRGAAADRVPGPDRDREVRPAGPRGLADQMDVVRHQPAADPVRGRPARPDGARGRRARGPTSCCARGATRSRGARPRCSRTSSPSACSACRRRAERRRGLRPDRGPAGDQERRPRAARRALADGEACARPRRPGRYDDALWSEIVELGWPGIAVAERYGGQGLGAVELAVLLEELGYACAATPFLSTAVVAAVIQADRQR